jgi:hypothetical protein
MTHNVPKVAAQLDRLKIICERLQREGEPSPEDQKISLKQDMTHFLHEYNYLEVETDNYHSPEKIVNQTLNNPLGPIQEFYRCSGPVYLSQI